MHIVKKSEENSSTDQTTPNQPKFISRVIAAEQELPEVVDDDLSSEEEKAFDIGEMCMTESSDSEDDETAQDYINFRRSSAQLDRVHGALL